MTKTSKLYSQISHKKQQLATEYAFLLVNSNIIAISALRKIIYKWNKINLKNLRRSASLSQNVDEMFFMDKGRLDNEFDALYAPLFDKSEASIKIVEALSAKNKGLTRDELLKATKLKSNGQWLQ